jgi:hypothetical protein
MLKCIGLLCLSGKYPKTVYGGFMSFRRQAAYVQVQTGVSRHADYQHYKHYHTCSLGAGTGFSFDD